MIDGDRRELNARSTYLDDEIASDCILSNLDQVYPEWKHPKPDIAIQRWDRPDTRPWPTSPVSQLIWLVVSEAQPWVPTWDQLRELGQRRIAERAHTGLKTTKPKQRQPQLLNKGPGVTAVIEPLNKEIPA